MPDNKEHEHIPAPSSGDQDEEPQQRGLLAPVLDPVGKVLETGLSPLGKGVETITKPLATGLGGVTKPALGPLLGEKEEKAEVLGGNNKDSYVHGKQSLGKREQTGDNPLGLDQTGKWGFSDDK